MRHLFALVPGDAAPQLLGELHDGGAHRLLDGDCGLVHPQVEQEHIAGGSLDQRADSALVVGAHDEVSLPVTRDSSVVDLGGTIRDHDHAGHVAPAVDGAYVFALGSPRAQTASELPAQLAPSLDIERLIDRLVADLHAWIIAELEPETLGDLLGRPELFEPSGDLVAEAFLGEFEGLRPLSAATSSAMGVPGSIVISPAVGGDLTQDR